MCSPTFTGGTFLGAILLAVAVEARIRMIAVVWISVFIAHKTLQAVQILENLFAQRLSAGTRYWERRVAPHPSRSPGGREGRSPLEGIGDGKKGG